jgi:carboxyl-terminal processing protease
VLSRLHTDDSTFDDTELPIGKIAPGETKTFTTKIKVPKDSLDRVNHISVEVKEARNATARITPTLLAVEAAPRPTFAYAYQLIDDGNGDGLVQKGEKFRLAVQLKNTGVGPTQEATVVLRNATGDGVVLKKSRVELKDAPINPGQSRELEFEITTDQAIKGDELNVELIAYDAALDVQSSEKLHFKLQPPVQGAKAMGEMVVSVKTPAIIRSGASDDTSVVGTAPRGASYRALGTFGPFTKVALDSKKVGFVPTQSIGAGGAGNGSYVQLWNSTPPMIALNLKGLETTADTYKLSGAINDEEKVEDVYIFVSNSKAKIDSRKVFYRSNRGARDLKQLAFSADLPLWPGSNMITVIARSNTEVRSVKTMYVYREPPRTASAPKQ